MGAKARVKLLAILTRLAAAEADTGDFKQNQSSNLSTPLAAPTLCLHCVGVLTSNKHHLMLAEHFEDGKCFLKCLSAMISKESTELLCQAGKERIVFQKSIVR